MWPFPRKPPVVTKSLADPGVDLLALFNALPSAAGVNVNPASAMRLAAVRRAVQAIAEPIGSLPLHVYRRDGETRERDREHPVAKVVTDPNPWTGGHDFREQLQRDALLFGNGLAAIGRTAAGTPGELIRYRPGTVAISEGEYGQSVYTAGGVTLDPRDVLHLKAPGICAWRGDSPITEARDAIGLGLLLEQFTSKLFANSAQPGTVVSFPQGVGDKAIANFLTAWKAAHTGASNAGKPTVIADGGTVTPLGFDPVSAQLLELRRYAVEEISRVFGVPPTMLYELGRATWANTEQLGSSFLTYTLMRWIKAWQSEIRLKLFAPDERDTWFAEFKTDDLLTVDFAARATAYGQYRTMGAMTANEVRKGLNLPPMEGGDVLANPAITPGAPPANDNTPKEAAANG
jgi:HK97 family phage portal protein